MGNNMSIIRYLVVLLAAVPLAHAQDRGSAASMAFYPKDSAVSTYSNDVKVLEPTKLEYFPRSVEEIKALRAKRAAEKAHLEKINNAARLGQDYDLKAEPAPNKNEQNQDVTRLVGNENAEAADPAQKIVSEFGDPTGDGALNVAPDAPMPFKGMMAAFHSGNKELAFQYARQFVRYLKNFEGRMDDVSGAINAAMVSEGMMTKEEAKTYSESKKFMGFVNKDLAERNKNGLTVAGLDPKLQAMLSQARDAEFGEDPADNSGEGLPNAPAPGFDENKARADVRNGLIKKLPADPFGEVEIFFFFKSRDEISRQMLADVEQLNLELKASGKAKLVGLALDRMTDADIADLRNQFKLTFPISNGLAVAKQMQLKGYPTTVVIAKNTKQAVVEEGLRRFYYLDELVRVIQGRAPGYKSTPQKTSSASGIANRDSHFALKGVA